MAKWRERQFGYLLLTFHTPYELLTKTRLDIQVFDGLEGFSIKR
jgi:hypothetical protein